MSSIHPTPGPSNGASPSSIRPSPAHALPDVIKVKLHLRKGVPQARCRSTKDLPEPKTWDHNFKEDSFIVFCERIRSRIPDISGLLWHVDDSPYVQPSHNAPQRCYIRLSEDNYYSQLTRAWRMEARRLNDCTRVFVHIFVYLSNSENRSKTESHEIQRGTQTQIQTAYRLIASAVEKQILPAIGPITTAYYARHIARLPRLPSNEELELPQTNTYQQLQHLDTQMEGLKRKKQEEAALKQEEFRV
ncbi:hypothetical protein BGZ49_000916, partial [Haplosporangium sp. Z 27]